MHIFIDESGGFQCTDKLAAPSCVGATIIPGRHLQEIELRFRVISARTGPKGRVKLKAGC